MRAGPSNLPTLHLLLIEDHDDTRRYLSLLLESAGHSVTTAGTVSEALIAFFENDVDVLISDIGLPDGTGWELLRQLQLSRPVYAIAMSGFGSQGERAKSLEAGFRRYLVKPFDPAELESALVDAAMELKCAH
jgi:DNA-binding response OmpR family regulator